MPNKIKPVFKHESWWTIKCAQNSCATSAVWYNTNPRTLNIDNVGTYGGPNISIDPGFGALVKVTFEIIKQGKTYPVNPFDPKRPRRRPTTLKPAKKKRDK